MPEETTQTVDAAYESFVCTKKHIIDPNRVMLPVCKLTDEDEEQDEAIIQLAPPQHRLIVDFVCEKLGQVPYIPDPTPNPTLTDDPDNNDINMTLLKAEVTPAHIVASVDGRAIRYRITGQYIYGFKRWRRGRINAALPPWLKNTEETAVTYQRPFYGSTDIINPTDETGDALTAGEVFLDALS